MAKGSVRKEGGGWLSGAGRSGGRQGAETGCWNSVEERKRLGVAKAS